MDAGADLVIGNHSHRLQPIELYEGKFICYSLGNFCFAGNSKPSDMTSILFQVRYRVKNGEISYKDYKVIPIRISSNPDKNDFIPTPFASGIQSDSVINSLIERTETNKDIEYGVTDLKDHLEWK